MGLEVFRKLGEVSQELGHDIMKMHVVGSSLISGDGNDIDIICLGVSDDGLIEAGYELESVAGYDSNFHSWRKDDVNILQVDNPVYFLCEIAIARGAKCAADMGADMSSREKRVAFHAYVRSVVMEYIIENGMGKIA